MKKQKILWLSLIFALIMSVSAITAFAADGPTLTVKTTSLELENAVYMNFKVQSQNISDTSSVKLLVWESYPGEYVKGTEDAELSVMRTEAGTGYLVFQYTDLAAKDMTKFVYVCAYTKVNGEDVYSKPTKFSIVQYAYNTQTNASASESLKTLVNNMLAYGASAQTYFNYKTDFLATDPIVKVRVEGGTHADGFKTMYYQKGEMAMFIAAAPAEGTVFSHWENSKGISVGTSSTLSIPVNADDTYTAIYRDASAPYTEELIFVLSEDKTYYIVNDLAEECTDTHIVIPAIYNGLPVKEIGDLAFNSRFEITAVTIPDSVTYIGHGAFKFCERLEKINMSANIEYVGYEAFHATAYYNDAENRENGALYIGNCLYEIDESTETYTVKDGTMILAYYAFGKTSELKEIYLPNSLTAITPFHFSVTYDLLAIHVNDDHPTFMVKNGDLYSKDGTVLLQYAIGKTDEGFVVPSHVTVIEESAFEDADSLKSVTISEGVTQIGMYAFYGCNYLESIVLPDTLADIDNGAFAFCERLESIELPDGLQRIGANAFSGCLSLKCMDIPESVTEIGETAFADCHGLTSVTIPEGHKYIGYGWFGACSSLKTVVIPNGVERIDPLAFAFCENLEYIVLPKTLTYIAEEAFMESNNLKYVCYEGALNDFDFTGIEEGNESFFNAPYHCYYGETCPLDEFNFWWHYNKNGEIEVWSHLHYSLSEDETYYSVIGKNNYYNETEIVIPPMYKGLPVKSIKYFSFEDDTTITSVVIPDSVTSIERFAFSGCTALEEIVMSENVTFVGSSAFHGTAYYNNAENWENGALYIGHCLYAVDDEVETLAVKEGTTLLADLSLIGDNLKELSLPNSLEALSGDYYGEGLTAIYVKASHPTAMSEDGILYSKDGTQLICCPAGREEESFAVPNGVTLICGYAFRGAAGLKFVTLPESLTDIGMEAFFGCENLVSINLPDALKTIGEAAFYGCVSLESVEFPKGLQSIGAEAFEGCMSLKTLILPDASTEIGEMAFAFCRGLESIEIPEGFTHIGGAWFGACSSLKTVVIPNGVEIIDEAAFVLCESLTDIVIPNSVTLISESAFWDSNNLQNVYFHGTEEEWNKITVCADNDPLIEATVYYYSATRPATEGNFWCYDSKGGIAIWKPVEADSANELIFILSEDETYYIVSGQKEDSTANKIVIPTAYKGLPVKEIAESAFKQNRNIYSVTIPEGVTSISPYAFYGCSNLTSVKLPASVINIHSFAFYGCKSLASITIPSTVTYIGGYAFSGCSSLMSVALPNDLTMISTGIFQNCSNLNRIVIPNGVKTIEEAAFLDCGNLKNVYFHGAEAEWNAISVYADNDVLETTTIYYYSETQPTTSGNFWCYDSKGGIAIWK